MLRGRIAVAPRFTRAMSIPGWQTNSRSSGSAKSKEQRDVERRKRQVEKLPSPVALHDHQYPLKKTVLNDQDFQRPVFASHLDSPDLYSPTPPDDFFVSWNIRDCGRTVYPPVPEVDHRFLTPAPCADWEAHRSAVIQYLHKHQIVPGMFPGSPVDCNLSVTFSESREFTRENFWMSAHCGNFMELKSCQSQPQVRFSCPDGEEQGLYTLVVASPDYPSRGAPNRGFFLHWVCSNLKPNEGGDTKVAYVPPLPTEDAGSARVLCMLFKQSEPVSRGEVELPFEVRRNFRLHDSQRTVLTDLDSKIAEVPRAITFFQTVWDIQVQEWYERAGIPEPAYIPDDLESILSLGSMTKEQFQIRSKTLPDGSINDTSKVLVQQYGETVHERNRANTLLSARTKLSKDRKTFVVPS